MAGLSLFQSPIPGIDSNLRRPDALHAHKTLLDPDPFDRD
jgi:hypothetical protein